jgi:hypothetical protein
MTTGVAATPQRPSPWPESSSLRYRHPRLDDHAATTRTERALLTPLPRDKYSSPSNASHKPLTSGHDEFADLDNAVTGSRVRFGSTRYPWWLHIRSSTQRSMSRFTGRPCPAHSGHRVSQIDLSAVSDSRGQDQFRGNRSSATAHAAVGVPVTHLGSVSVPDPSVVHGSCQGGGTQGPRTRSTPRRALGSPTATAPILDQIRKNDH